MTNDNEKEIEQGLVSVRIEQDGNGRILEVEIIDGRWADSIEFGNAISADPAKCRNTSIWAGYRNGGDSLDETERYDSGTIFVDNWK